MKGQRILVTITGDRGAGCTTLLNTFSETAKKQGYDIVEQGNMKSFIMENGTTVYMRDEQAIQTPAAAEEKKKKTLTERHRECYEKALDELDKALKRKDWEAADKLTSILQRLK